ncbi:MAG: translation initiation factor IF-3 [Deltaproteobacteria bacterium]|nr:translation initiation factor IF-3 [Deltaproteobacteria bacterium]
MESRERGTQGPRINHRIRIPQVRVIGPDGDMLGILDTAEAQRIARENGLDLVEVNPKSYPPVCKIMDFGKYKYDEKKKQAEAKKKQVVIGLKEIKLRPKTDDHDLEFKLKHVRRFLQEGNKVKITCRFRGREITHPEAAQKQLDLIAESIKDVGMIETGSRMEGRNMMLILAPQSKAK